ncbi:SDR family NAD(P)-dependent oxidoreductase [Pseudorhodoferax sp. Leaf267]|uniref:SDR family NAD(P)-dependent oxidoreductase n=1 Tax=Pseudorhodoferax sp. Leaf267 TaxID=1736316 RepID=UPI0006F28957|nr:SDR family NAD(P)-dependent oxidoreductase [Pseudorhodoferax sp. Leaf267]KQP22759.1 short-chain dehydrogenase [Pseudorhodoferax sp. Leaf267]
MTQHLTILTGASRGMGLGLARQLLREGQQLLCISRQANAELAVAGCTQWQADLADGGRVAARLADWLAQQDAAQWASATLINNAGVIPALVPLSAADPADLAHALRVGLEAPMQLTAAFLGATTRWPGQRRVLNISSGLGRRAMAAQAGYCAAKAGMDHFTRCLALDEAARPNGAKVCSLAPGVIDTEMQQQLRSADRGSFPDQGNFAQLHSSGQLTSPDEAATRVLAYLARPNFGANPVADVRDPA